MNKRVLLTVSGVIPDDVQAQVAVGVRPRPDYALLKADVVALAANVRNGSKAA